MKVEAKRAYNPITAYTVTLTPEEALLVVNAWFATTICGVETPYSTLMREIALYLRNIE